MKDNIITWTPTNWITIFLMALGGFFILGTATKAVKAAIAAKSGNTSDAQAA